MIYSYAVRFNIFSFRSLLEILTDSESGTGDDKLRLFLIYFLLSPNVTDAELDELTGALLNSGVSMASLTYLKRIRNFSMVGNKQMEYSSSQGGTTKVWWLSCHYF